MTKFFCKKHSKQLFFILGLFVLVFFVLPHAEAGSSTTIQESKISLEPILNGPHAYGSEHVGHLGGMKVRIPKNAISIIEYDGEPNWLDPEKNKYKEKPTENSGIRAISFRLRIIDNNKESQLPKDAAARQHSNNEEIIFVGMNSSSHFGTGNGLEMRAKLIDQDPRLVYEKDLLDSYGLTKFRVVQRHDADLSDVAKANRLRSQKDYFVKRNQYGRVVTWIQCSINGLVNNVCTHHYYPDVKRPIEVYFTYKAKYLSNWEHIQNYTTQRINSFSSF